MMVSVNRSPLFFRKPPSNQVRWSKVDVFLFVSGSVLPIPLLVYFFTRIA
jgi:hypothetical protein